MYEAHIIRATNLPLTVYNELSELSACEYTYLCVNKLALAKIHVCWWWW